MAEGGGRSREFLNDVTRWRPKTGTARLEQAEATRHIPGSDSAGMTSAGGCSSAWLARQAAPHHLVTAGAGCR